MPEENIQGGSANAGSPNINGSSQDQANSPNNIDLSQYVPKSTYEELEQKLGVQGNELGNYRETYKQLTPLLDKLQNQPEVINEIMSGRINTDLAKAITEGKIKLEDATQVAQAHAEVKKEVGDKNYEKLTADEITNLVGKKLEEVISKFDGKFSQTEQKFNDMIKQSEEVRKFENHVNEFIKNTTDYKDYASDIDQWLDEHPEIDDIEVAYFAVKGKKSTAEAIAEAEKNAIEEAKKVAMNGAANGSQGGNIVTDKNIVDALFGGYRDPNA